MIDSKKLIEKLANKSESHEHTATMLCTDLGNGRIRIKPDLVLRYTLSTVLATAYAEMALMVKESTF